MRRTGGEPVHSYIEGTGAPGCAAAFVKTSGLLAGRCLTRGAGRAEAAHVMLLRPVFRLHQATNPGGKLPNDADEGHLGYSGSSVLRQPIRWLPGRAFSESLLLISYVRYPERFPNNRSADYGSCQETDTCAW